MNVSSKSLAAAILSLGATSAEALGDVYVDRAVQPFLKALATSGDKPPELLVPKEARKGLVAAQAGVKVDVSGVVVSQRTIREGGLELDLIIVRPAGVKKVLPAFMFFHGGGWVLGQRCSGHPLGAATGLARAHAEAAIAPRSRRAGVPAGPYSFHPTASCTPSGLPGV